MIFIFYSIVPSEEKDDGDYESPTSRDETPDEKKEAIKRRETAEIKK